jgi:HEAT repeat protein
VYLECVAIDTLAKIRTGDPKAIAAVLERLRPKDFFVRNKASTALLQMDAKQPESVRALAAGLRHKDQSVRMTVATSLRVRDEQGKLPPDAHAEMLAPVLAAIAEFDESMSVNHLETYVMLLRRFGTRAAPAGEHLVKIYQSEAFFKRLGTYGAYVRGKLLAALANIGVPESGRELVLEALQKGPGSLPNEASTFAAAARAAATFADPKQVVPLLLPGLKVKGKEQALYFIDWSGDGQGKPTTVRLEAVRALAKMGPAATEALPALKEVIEGNAESPPSLDLLVRMEARRAYETIDGKPLPAIKGFYADGKKESLHLDERLQVKITMKLRNPRPQDVLNRLQQATKLNFTMNEHVDQETPVWATSHQVNVQVYHAMRQLAAMANIQGTWEDVGDGYRLVAKPRTPDDKAKAAKAAKASFPPFRDDSFDPLPNDPRLQKALSINLTPAKAQDIVRRVQDATGVTLTLENVDTVNPLYAGIGWSNISAWQALRNVAESPRVQGTWEKVGDGYRLRGTQPIPPPGVAPPVVARPVAPKPAIAQADPGQAATAPQPGRRLLLVLGIGLLVIVLAGGAMAFWLRERGV